MSARPGPSGGYHASDIPTGISLTPFIRREPVTGPTLFQRRRRFHSQSNSESNQRMWKHAIFGPQREFRQGYVPKMRIQAPRCASLARSR